ncbi:MAG: hypothetical protein AAF214_11415, partial [Pseudomonadota bacterium]
EIVVLLFGEYNGSKQVTGTRMKKVCQAFLPALQAELANTKYHRIVVTLVWPRVANPGDYVPASASKVAIQPGFSSAKCRGVRFFG